MPLLKRKAFEKSTVSEYLRDDDEVFHCEITDEIFKDYEEYCERIILVNSMVWTCEMTGKNYLTYSEALLSEKTTRKQLKDFPMELRIPILYLATKTHRCSFAEMSEDIFNFVRDRYFVGETVEACLEGDNWQEAHVLSVTSQKQHPDSKTMIPSSSYCYEVEQFNEEDSAVAGQIGTVSHERVRRRKGLYTRDKNRLFLKQFVQGGPGGVITIKKTALDKYNIARTSFDQIFTGKPPEFPSSKRLLKTPPANKSIYKPGSASKSAKKPSPDKKGRQESMDKFLKKADKTDGTQKPRPAADPAAKKSAQELAEKMRRAEDQMRKRKEEEKARKKEKTARLQAYYKEWQRVKDDLELEDHKVLPKGTPIDMEGISQQYVGDFLSVLEFVHVYGDILKAKDTFHNKFDIETFRKALTQKEHAGTFSELVQMFLTTIFTLQEDEAEDYNESKGIQLSTDDAEPASIVGVPKAIELATKASKWSQTYLGTPLSQLPLNPHTVSEVLRLHLLSSGSVAGSRCATWRYHQRGGYSSHDDAGLRLRCKRPDLLRRLAVAHVADLPLDDKFQVLQCLMNQILSYATVRDVIEEKLEEQKNSKIALRALQINERKREAQVLASKQELKKEAAAKKEASKLTGDKARAVDEELRLAIEKLNADSELKKKEFESKMKQMQTELFDYTSYLGSDRAYRRYWLNQAVGGVFVEAGDEARGPCRDKLVLPAAPGDDTLAYVTGLFEAQRERAGSDKENDSAANSRGNSPKKPLTNLNGLSHKLNGLDSNMQQLKELLVCSGDHNMCLVHGKGDFRPRWWVLHTEEQLSALIEALNKRGVREHELRQALELDRDNIRAYMDKCPLHMLNPNAAPAPTAPSQRIALRKQFVPSLAVPPDCSLAEALELALRDHILELEEKIFHGCLGVLKVKDREAWRGTLMLRGYDKQAQVLTWGAAQQYRDDCHLPDGVLKLPHDGDASTVAVYKYRDPGQYLEGGRGEGGRGEGGRGEGGRGEGGRGEGGRGEGGRGEGGRGEGGRGEGARDQGGRGEGGRGEGARDQGGRGEGARDVVRGLASALLQVSQALHHKYIKKPLGLDEKERKEREARSRPAELAALHRWEESLMASASLAAVALHVLALDRSVAWAHSALHAACRLCRRRADPDNMLLCDGCNKGHHLYCLKPKLASVPEGDWFCESCKPRERTPRKRRKLFTEDDLEDTLNSEEESLELDAGVCGACGSGGRLRAACAACGARYHTECATPRPARAARRWLCAGCLAPAREHQPTRRCAAAALTNIHHYTRALHSRRSSSESEDSEYNTALVKLKKYRNSKESSPVLNGNTKKTRKSKDEVITSSGRKSKNSLTNGHHHEEKSSKKRSSRQSELHAEALHALMRDVMKHKDSWPFYDPVNTDDVPDYLSIIEQPMDLSSIKGKLEREEYSRDEQLVQDLALVFLNCATYNQDSHPVAKAGSRLEKYVIKRCSELQLPPPAAQYSEAEAGVKRGSEDDSDGPRSKRAKLK